MTMAAQVDLSHTPQHPRAWFPDGRARRNGILIWGSCLVFFLALYSYMAILAVFAKSLGATPTLIGLAVGIYGIGQMIFRIPVGVTADLLGTRKFVIAAGMGILVLSDVGMGLSNDALMIVLFRVPTSLGASTYLVYAVLLAQQFTPERRSTAMGTLTSVSNAGILAGLWIGGQLAQASGGYRVPFFWGAAFAVVGALLILMVRETRAKKGTSINLRRLVEIGFMPSILAVSAAFIVGVMAWYGAQYTLLPLYAQKTAEFSKAALGNLAMISSAAGTLSAFAAGAVADRIGRRIPALAGLLILLVTMLLIPSTTDRTMIFVMSACIGLGYGICWATFMAMALSVIEGAEQATAMGVFMAYYALGMYLGPQTGGLVLQFFGYSNSFYSLAALVLVGVLLTLFAIPRRLVEVPKRPA